MSILIAMAFGAVFGGLGGWLASRIDAPAAKVVVTVVMIGIGLALGRVVGDRFEARAFQQDLETFSLADYAEEVPVFGALIEHDPAEAEALETAIRTDVAGGAYTQDEAIDRARILLSTIVTEKVITRPADVQKEFTTIAGDMFSHFRETRPELCGSLALGELVGDLAPYLPDGHAEREQAVMVRVIATPALPDVEGNADRGAAHNAEMAADWFTEQGDGADPSTLTGEQWCDLILLLNDQKLTEDNQLRRDLFAAELRSLQ